MPSGTRMPLDMAFMDTVMQRFPPALSPTRQTRSAVEPETRTYNYLYLHNNDNFNDINKEQGVFKTLFGKCFYSFYCSFMFYSTNILSAFFSLPNPLTSAYCYIFYLVFLIFHLKYSMCKYLCAFSKLKAYDTKQKIY